MRYVQKPIYKFEELSEKAKARATSYLNDEHFWGADSIASLEAFSKYFNVKITSWNYAPFGHAEIETDVTNNTFRGFKLDKARAIPENLTGYYMDYGLREVFIKYFEKTGAAKSAFIEAMENGIKSVRDDWESQYSEEYVQDHCNANEYEFDEDGGLI